MTRCFFPLGGERQMKVSPAWKNFPEKPRLKVKLGTWVRSSLCVSSRAWEKKKKKEKKQNEAQVGGE